MLITIDFDHPNENKRKSRYARDARVFV